MSIIETTRESTRTTLAEREATKSKWRQAADARREARNRRAAEPHYVDMLEGLSALAGRQPSILQLGPPSPIAESLEVGGIGPEVREAMGFKAQKTAIVREAVPPARGLQAAWDVVTSRTTFTLGTSGRPAVPTSHLSFEIKQLVEVLGPDLIAAILNAKGLPRCDLAHKGEAPVAFTIVAPFRTPICEEHLNGAAT